MTAPSSGERLNRFLTQAENGYHLVPCRITRLPNGRKRAFFPRGWKGDVPTTDPELIRDWFVQLGPETVSFAIAHGPSSTEAVDLDPKDGGPARWADLGMPGSPDVVETPSGGAHLYWRRVGDGIGTNAGKLGAGIDARSIGGVTFAPGSVVIGADGEIEPAHYVGDLPKVADLEPTPEAVLKAFAEHRAAERVDDGRTTVKDYDWVVSALREQRERVRAFDPRTESGFRELLMGAAMMLGRVAQAGVWPGERLAAALEADAAGVWGQADDDDREWIRRGMVDGPARERWEVTGIPQDPVSASEPDAEPEVDSWAPVDLGPYLDGTVEPIAPSVGVVRSDGSRLLYPGLEHAIIGEMESGKSWLALACAAAELKAGNRVVYVHFEESSPAETIERLRLLLVPTDRLREDFVFIGPERRVGPGVIAGLVADRAPTLVVLDGQNEAMALHGQGIREEDGAADFRRLLVKPFARCGAAVVTLDHVVKDPDRNGQGYALGSVHKGNGLNGALILVENVDPFGKGRNGSSQVYVTKDRPGELRRLGRPTRVARKFFVGMLYVEAESGPGGMPRWVMRFEPPAPVDDGPDAEFEQMREDRRNRQVDEQVLAVVLELYGKGIEVSTNKVRGAVKGRASDVTDALYRLERRQLILNESLGQAARWAPFRPPQPSP